MRGIGRIISAVLILALVGPSLLAPVSTANHEFPASPDLKAIVSTGALCEAEATLLDECSDGPLDASYLWEIRYCLENDDPSKELTIVRTVGTDITVEERTVHPQPDQECTTIQGFGVFTAPACVELEVTMGPASSGPVSIPEQENRDFECAVPGDKNGYKAPILSDR